MQNVIPITKKGSELLQEELQRLKTVDRPAVIAAISEARAHGDLKENAEYHAAREQQSFLEGRIQEIESTMANCRVIDISQMPNTGKVIFGSTVTLLNVETEEEVTYQIVGEDEADLKEHKISVSSPIARGLVGKFVDDVVEITTPNGFVEYEVMRVEYI